MRGLPIVNLKLKVEAVGFKQVGNDQVGILISPWFMNLVVLPGTEAHDHLPQGEEVEWEFPGGKYALTCCRDDALGFYLSAILFRTVADFPDQQMACDIAATILDMLFAEPEDTDGGAPKISRRELFAQLGAS